MRLATGLLCVWGVCLVLSTGFCADETSQPPSYKKIQEMTVQDYEDILARSKDLPALTEQTKEMYGISIFARIQLKQYAEALPVVELWTRDMPQDPSGWVLLGIVYKGLGNREASQQAFQQWLKLLKEQAGTLELEHQAWGIEKVLE